MDIENYINTLNKMKPTIDEMVAKMDVEEKSNSALIAGLMEDYNYQINSTKLSFSSEIFNVIYNSNVYLKGIFDFHFARIPEDEFALTDQEHVFFLDAGGMVYVNIFGDCQLVSDSEDDFLLGMLCCFEAHVEFIYRRHRFNVDDILLSFVEKVPSRNSDYFVERIMSMYPSE